MWGAGAPRHKIRFKVVDLLIQTIILFTVQYNNNVDHDVIKLMFLLNKNNKTLKNNTFLFSITDMAFVKNL